MTSGTNIKDRCRLCYTRLKETSTFHQKLGCSQPHHRIYNIYKRRPFRYRDLIVRYLSISLPESNPNDRYSNAICGTCASSLTQLETTYRSFDRTQKLLRSKFRKTSQITRHQIDRQTKLTPAKASNEQKPAEPKRVSKRKGAPKHIDQTLNHHKKATGSVQMIVKIHSPDRADDVAASDEEKECAESESLFSSLPTKRTSPRRKLEILTETTNQKKKFKRSTKDSGLSNTTSETSNHESFNCVNLLKSSTPTDTSIHNLPARHSTTPGSSSTSSSASNSRPFSSVKGNHIERIAVSLLSGTDTQSDNGIHHLHASNGTNDHTSDPSPSTSRRRRKPTSSGNTPLDVTTTNNILSSNYNNVATVLSPSLDEPDDDALSLGDASTDNSNASTSGMPLNGANIPSVNKHLPTSISTMPTAEGLTITAINTTGQKQVFMAKQLGNLKKYQCGLCEKIVTNIQIHVRRHTNDKPYPCTYCEKRFTNSGDLQIHVRIHTGEKPYACPLCLKSYRTIGNFNSHVKTHDSGVRPHRCELCDQIFPIPKDWYSHLRSSHRSRIPTTSLPSSNGTAATNTGSSLSATNATTTVTQPLFSNALSSHQQHSESFVASKVKLEPINRSQLIIKSSNADDQEPVNMSKKEGTNDPEDDEEEAADDDDDDDEEEENHRRSTRNLLANVSSPVRA